MSDSIKLHEPVVREIHEKVLLQDREEPDDLVPMWTSAGGFRLRTLYSRSRDSQIHNVNGQDFLAYKEDGARLCFVVCDGVGMSFFGDLAAKFLGTRLLKWAWQNLECNVVNDKEEIIAKRLAEFLKSLVPAATLFVNNFQLPAEMPILQRDSLNKTRVEHGSQTTFALGMLLLPERNVCPDGALALAWMGNTEIQVLRKKWALPLAPSECVFNQEESEKWTDKRRWSSLTGPVGKPLIYVSKLKGVERVWAYTDGLASIREELNKPMESEALAKQVRAITASPKSDDIAFIEITIGERPAGFRFALPQISRYVFDGTRLQAEWVRVTDADSYHVTVEAGAPLAKVFDQALNSTALEFDLPKPARNVRMAVQPQGARGEQGPTATVALAMPMTIERDRGKRAPRWRNYLLYLVAMGLSVIAACTLGFLLGTSFGERQTTPSVTPSAVVPLIEPTSRLTASATPPLPTETATPRLLHTATLPLATATLARSLGPGTLFPVPVSPTATSLLRQTPMPETAPAQGATTVPTKP